MSGVFVHFLTHECQPHLLPNLGIFFLKMEEYDSFEQLLGSFKKIVLTIIFLCKIIIAF